ncbi:MAG: hypothetical protein Q9226_007773 [Calogaya cf. arnoldii]
MTSRRWSPGNSYNGVVEPRYAILSYTWGRFEKPGYPPLRIGGIDWDVPSIDPAHFTVAHLSRLLGHIGSEYDFVWIDIACIDQKREKDKMQEVGRQAIIFKRAKQAYIWLNKYEPTVIQGHVQARMRYGSNLAQWSLEPLQAAKAFNDELVAILQDPWFSSLWTLQESVLQRHALLLNKSGLPITTTGPWIGESPVTQLMDLSGACGFTRAMIDLAIHAEQAADSGVTATARIEKMQSFRSTIDRSGIDFTLCPNPNIQYAAAIYRQTSRPEDRIYAIMQLYGYRLGNSAAEIRKLENFSLSDLETQFLRSLTTQSALLSQAFQHLEIPRPGQSWCILNRIRVPERLHLIVVHDQFLSSGCTIAVHHRAEAYFEGYACPFQDLCAFWRQRGQDLITAMETASDAPNGLLERRHFFNPATPSRDTYFRRCKYGLTFDISHDLDAVAMSFEWPPDTSTRDDKGELIIESRPLYLAAAAESNRKIMARLTSQYGESALMVLYLGTAEHTERMMVALILVQTVVRTCMLRRKVLWKRIGTCFWYVEGGPLNKLISSMKILQGTFG